MTVLRRAYALTAACILPLGAVLLYDGRRDWALGLCFGTVVSLVNAGMLVWRIQRAADLPVTVARRVMGQGMGVRFALVMLAAVVTIAIDPRSIPGFVLGLLFGLALLMAAAVRALFAAVAADQLAARTNPPALLTPSTALSTYTVPSSPAASAMLVARYRAGHGDATADVPLLPMAGISSASTSVQPRGRTVS